MLNIISDVIHDVIDKHVYVWRISLSVSEPWDCFGNDWLQLLQRRVDVLNNMLI